MAKRKCRFCFWLIKPSFCGLSHPPTKCNKNINVKCKDFITVKAYYAGLLKILLEGDVKK